MTQMAIPWGSPLSGPDGKLDASWLPDGVAGPKGDKGDPGTPGVDGADSIVPGPPGDPGTPGVDGADSVVPGPPGADSTVPGPKGDPGIQGPPGTGLIMGGVTADVANNSNVNFVNLFTQAVLPGERWSFEATIFYSSQATTTGLVSAVDAPTAPTWAQFMMSVGTTATAWLTVQTPTPGTAMVGTAALTTPLRADIAGTVQVGANAGNIVIKFRSEINLSAITVKRGSFCKWMKH